MQVFLWDQGNAAAHYQSLIRLLNMDLLISTDPATNWSLKLKTFRKRQDLRKRNEFTGITEALEQSLFDDLMDSSSETEKILYLMADEQDEKTVWAYIDDGPHLKLTETSLASVEQILIPKTDADYKFRQSIKVQGIVIAEIGLKLALVHVGADATALWIESSSLDLAQKLVPKGIHPIECEHPIDYIKALRKIL